MTAVDLMDDLANAVVDTILDNEGHFEAILGEHATEGYKAEYARDGVTAFVEGRNGVCRVYVDDPEPMQSFTGSAQARARILLQFDLIETKGQPKKKSRCQSAVASVFGDTGKELWTNFTDSGSNVLGGSGQLVVQSVDEVAGADRGPANIVIEARLLVILWHRIPLVYEV